MPKVSVVMSVYNEIKFIDVSLKSILNQTLKDLEIIIVDDQSTDGTNEYLLGVNDSRVKVLINPVRQGLTKNLIKGIELSRGEYIARMDADDICLPERFEKQLSFLQKNPDIDVCGTSFIQINERNEMLSIVDLPLKNEDLKAAILLDRWAFAHPAVMMKRSVAHYSPEYIYSQDLKLWLDLWNGCKFANIRDHVLLYRVHSKQISTHKKEEQDYFALKAYESFLPRADFEPHMQLIGRKPILNFKDAFVVLKWFIKLNTTFTTTNTNKSDLLHYSFLLLKRNFQSVFKIFLLKLGMK